MRDAPTHEPPSGRLRRGELLEQQRVVGNRAVVRARAGASAAGRAPWVAPPDHASETEADAIASQVVRSLRGGGPPASRPAWHGAGLQRAAVTADAGCVSTAVDDGLAAARGGGRPLEGGLRSPLERAFGADLHGVRIHDDPRAHALSQGLEARAFTRGSDVYFARGAYRPREAPGLRLLAHELTHVLQQRGGDAGGAIQRYAADVPSTNTEEDDVSFTWSDSNTFEHQVEGKFDYLTEESATSLSTAPKANLATTDVSQGVHLNISGGGHLAVETLPGDKQAKAYYSSAEKLADSNTKLEAAGSSFEMRAVAEQGVTVHKNGTRELAKIYPVNRQTPVTNERVPSQVHETVGPDEMVSRQQCVDMAAAVVGTHHGGSPISAVKPVAEELLDDAGLLGARRQLLSMAISGVKEAKSSKQARIADVVTDITAIAEGSDSDGVAARLLPIFRDIKAKIASGARPEQATEEFVLELLTVHSIDQVADLARLQVLSDDGAGLASVLTDILPVLQDYALYLVLKYGEDRARLLVDSAGINEQAQPDVGEAYKITYLERESGQWNYHWGGVVARDGADSVTLENYTRDRRNEAAVKYVDPRWYFQMFGVGQQSFHTYHSAAAKGGLTLTQVGRKRTDEDIAAAPALSAADQRSKDVAGSLMKIRSALITGSVGRKSNAAYSEILALLRESALLAIHARDDPEQYAAIRKSLATIETKAADASSSKWGDKGTKRNAALADMLKAVKLLHTELASK